VRRALTALALIVALALALAGCGSGSSTTTASQGSEAPAPPGTPQGSSSATATTPGAAGATESGQGTSSSPPASSQTPENSIKTYGAAASAAQKAALGAAAFSFFRALAAPDYPKVCSYLTAANLQQLGALLKYKHQSGGCPSVLKMLISRAGAPEVRKAAAGKLTSVRVKGETAFVLFTPKGGQPSYFVMKREGSAWKATGLAPGTPLNPLSGIKK
jgi:uncharacterized protein YceK